MQSGRSEPSPPAAGSRPILFHQIRVFDGVRLLPGALDVLVAKGVIEAIGPKLAAPTGAEIVEGAGRTLLPGLIDAHTHSYGDAALGQALLFGVTTELDMFGPPEKNRACREREERGENVAEADLRSAGTCATVPGGHGTEYGIPIPTLQRPAEAAAFVAARLGEGSDYLKIIIDANKWFGDGIPTLDRPTVAALVEATHGRGRLAVAHIGSQAEARMALEVGVDGLMHTFMDRPPDEGFAALAAARGAFVVPTLAVTYKMCEGGSQAAVGRDAALGPYLMESDRRALASGFPRKVPAVNCTWARETVGRLAAAKVPILAGTDAANLGVVHGASLHRELELLVDAGLTPAGALAAATSVPAARFGLADRGRIAVGLRADLIAVEGDPTADIRCTRELVGIYKRGVGFDRSAARARVAAERLVIERERSAPAPTGAASGLVADFDDGELPRARFGAGWSAFSDADIASGGRAGDQGRVAEKDKGKDTEKDASRSSVTLAVVRGGAGQSGGALEIRGVVAARGGFAGALFSPGPAPGQPANLSAKAAIAFHARGDGGRYRIMVFARHRGVRPVVRNFVTGPAWTALRFPLEELDGCDGRDLTGVLVGGGGRPGRFALAIDDVRFE